MPVGRLTSSKNKDDKWPINAVANLALLEQADNVRKGNLTFKEYLDKQLENNAIDRSEHESKLEEYEDQLICTSDILPEDTALVSYTCFLSDRFEQLKDKFFGVWEENTPSI